MSISDLQKLISEKFTEDVLNEILRNKSGHNDVVVRDIRFGQESKKGDSYLSTVTKFSVTAIGKDGDGDQDIEVHVIVKSLPNNIARRKTFRSLDFFGNEIAFYNKIWPALDKFQKSKNVKKPFNSVPLCLATYADGLHDFIALEDLSFQGYQTLNRGAGLSYEQAKMVVKFFAHFHALSLAFKDQQPKEFEKIANDLHETYFDEKFRNWYRGTMKKFLHVARDAVEKQLPASYLSKFDEVTSGDLYGKLVKICATRGPLAVVTHGDCWAPNFLIKYANDGVTSLNTYMIDYQLARYSSLALDIIFFMYTCVEQSTRVEHWDALIKDYHESIMSDLKELGSSPSLVSLDSLKEDLKNSGLFGFSMCLEAIVMSLVEDDEVADIDLIQGDEEVPLDTVWIINPIRNEEKRQRVADFFKHLVDSNFI